jgi:hypothetical protein
MAKAESLDFSFEDLAEADDGVMLFGYFFVCV